MAFGALAWSAVSRPASGADDLNAIAIDAYIYAYPLVTMELTRRVTTNVASVGARKGAPMNQFGFLRAYPDASFTDVVAPNADTLYNFAWFDVSKEPIVIHLPALRNRYALFPILSAWTNVFTSPGTRTTGESAQTFALCGPGWSGTLPSGVREVKSPTAIAWMIGRIYADGTPADFAVVHKLQDAITAVPLSAYGKPYTPPPGHVDPSVDMKTPVVKQVNALTGTAFFTIFAGLLGKNPPAAADAPVVAQLAKLGIVPGKALDTSKLSPAVVAAMNAAPATVLPQLQASITKLGTPVNGWSYSTKLGEYGTEYKLRALVALFGLGANLAKDAVYPSTPKLDGSKNYIIHFAKGQTPPARAFWSVTLYNKDQFFYGNPLNRYNVSSRSKFIPNADGSVDVYVQHASPGASKEANWLPAPADTFSMIMRIYWPRETPPSILDGTWAPPKVQPQ
jgi:hypothetical protein